MYIIVIHITRFISGRQRYYKRGIFWGDNTLNIKGAGKIVPAPCKLLRNKHHLKILAFNSRKDWLRVSKYP